MVLLIQRTQSFLVKYRSVGLLSSHLTEVRCSIWFIVLMEGCRWIFSVCTHSNQFLFHFLAFENAVLRHSHLDIRVNVWLSFISSLCHVDNARWIENILALFHKIFAFLLAIFVVIRLLQIFHQVLDWDAIQVWERMLAEQINALTLFILVEVFFVDCVQFVAEHVKVILVQIRNRKLTFFWYWA